jgi:uncharacterized membrane protein YoaK (UPF0700 family)
MINAGGFMACHRFVSHITGFGTQMGINFAKSQFLIALEMLLIPLTFILGTIISAYLIDARQMNDKKARPDIVLLIITIVLFLVALLGYTGLFGEFGEAQIEKNDYVLISLLCLTTGMQNACVSSLTKNALRASHLTGIATDFGINLVKLRQLSSKNHEKTIEKKWNRIRFLNMLFFSIGSFFAVFIFSRFHYLGFIVPFGNSLIFLGLYFRAQKKLKLQETDYLKEFTHA